MSRGMLLATSLIVALFVACKKPDQTAPTAHQEEPYTPAYNSLDSMDAAPATTDTYQPAEPATDPYAGDSETLQPTSGEQRHVVQKGDTLYSLARKYYNNQARWKDIYNANRNVLSDPNKLKVGMELVIP